MTTSTLRAFLGTVLATLGVACGVDSTSEREPASTLTGAAGTTSAGIAVPAPTAPAAGTGGMSGPDSVGAPSVPPPQAGDGALTPGPGPAGTGGAGTDAAPPVQPILPPVTDVASEGPFTVTIDQGTGPTGAAWIVRPTDLGANGLLHPIFLWGPGAGATPQSYQAYLELWASHGFVVYSIVSTGNGDEMTAGIDWLEAENVASASLYFGKLDTSRVAIGGHSRGSLSSFGAGGDPRLKTTIHVAGGSFDGLGSQSLHAPTAYFCGELDTLATPNCERDYEATMVPVFFAVMGGIDHIMAANGSQHAVTAWLRWHLGGEEDRRALFLDPGCQFCTGTWVAQSKNW